MAMRDLPWIRRLVDDIAKGFGIAYDRSTVIKSTVFEDNQGAIAVANHPDLTQRTRHLHAKYHHFKEHLGKQDDGGEIRIEHINAQNQVADILTKGLGESTFASLRDKIMGWADSKSNDVQGGELECADSKRADDSLTESDATPTSEKRSTGLKQKRPLSQNGPNQKKPSQSRGSGGTDQNMHGKVGNGEVSKIEQRLASGSRDRGMRAEFAKGTCFKNKNSARKIKSRSKRRPME